MKKKICWVTPDCFIDVDYNSGILEKLLEHYSIHWIIVLSVHGRFKETDFYDLKKLHPNLIVEFVCFRHRARDIRTLFTYLKIAQKVRAAESDINYLNIVPESPYSLPLFLLPKKKTVYAAHDGDVKGIVKFGAIVGFTFKFCYGLVENVNMFSGTEAKKFKVSFSGKRIWVIPLAMKNFGAVTIAKRTDCISFLSFGTLHDEKNIGLLIEAANQLYEEGIQNFKVSINGNWSVGWSIDEKIRHPEIFELYIKPVPNDDIPNLFGYNHYAVYPYKQMSQSGALKVAFNYYNPVIVSNLPGFANEVENGIDGYVFESENVESLKGIMRKCIQDGREGYELLSKKMRKHVDAKYSVEAVASKYCEMFNEICKR